MFFGNTLDKGLIAFQTEITIQAPRKFGWHMYKFKYLIAIMLATLMLVLTSFPIGGLVNRALATCSGYDCDGQFPDSAGCASPATTTYIAYPASSVLEMRHSTYCPTYWTRTTNTDSLGRSFYANATLWFSVSPYYYTVPSGGPIDVNQKVFSQQRYSGSPFSSCGYVNGSYIAGPVSSPCVP